MCMRRVSGHVYVYQESEWPYIRVSELNQESEWPCIRVSVELVAMYTCIRRLSGHVYVYHGYQF